MRSTFAACASGLVLAITVAASGADWPQWCGTDGKNMVSLEKGLPDSFEPGERRPDGTMDPATAKNVRWGVRFCNASYSTPTVANGKIFVGGRDPDGGVFACFDAADGRLLWKWKAPAKVFPNAIDGFHIGVHEIPPRMGVCSTAAVDGDRVYFVSNRFEVICLDVNGETAARRPGRSGRPASYGPWTCRKSLACSPATRPTARP